MPYNVSMSHPEIIIPFSLPPAEHAKDLIKLLASECSDTGLAMLLSRCNAIRHDQFDDFARALPHELWLSQQRRYNDLIHQKMKLALSLSDGYWFLLQPVHLHIASTHLVLTDYRQLSLSDNDAQPLFQTAQERCAEQGLQLVYGDAGHWFLRCDDWSDFIGASPDAACGHNIEIWSPDGAQILAWRKLQNEIQMEWFIHPIQEQRQQRGEKIINGLWLWSGTLLQQNTPAAGATPITFNPDVREFIRSPQLIRLDQLNAAALAGDWHSWVQKMVELERTWFIPLCAALKSGQKSGQKSDQLKHVNLVLSNSNTLCIAKVTTHSLRRFWRRPNFNHLIA